MNSLKSCNSQQLPWGWNYAFGNEQKEMQNGTKVGEGLKSETLSVHPVTLFLCSETSIRLHWE